MLRRLLATLRSPRFPIFMIVFVDVLGLGIVIPVLPLFAQNELSAVAWQITSLTSLYFSAQLFAGPLLGRLSDRFGRRPVLIVSQTGTLIAHIITGSATSLYLLYASRLIDGVTGGNVSVAQAYLSDITEEKERARGLGIVNAAFGLGFVFGPAFGSLVASLYGPRVPFFAAAAVSLVTIILSIFLLPESLSPERRQREQAARAALQASGRRMGVAGVLNTPGVLLLLVVAFITQFAFFSFQTIFVLWSERLVFAGQPTATVQQAIGGILTVVGITGFATQLWLVGPLVRRLGERKLVVAACLVRGGAFLIMALSPTLFPTVAASMFVAISGGVLMPSIIALLTYTAPPDGRGQVIGLNQSASAAGSILGPLMSGLLFERLHPNAPMVAATVVMAAGVLLALQIFRLPIHRHQPVPST